ncbi:MAG TPA: CoA transferase [Acidimicrobiales bacterium]|nr:CoA transferase [Acidimicrobiales bacterium]
MPDAASSPIAGAPSTTPAGDPSTTPAGDPGETPAGPLAGVRVLDLTSVVMGPFATQVLGDLGAEVIVVEGTTLEANRVMGPGPHPQLSGVALNLMRNKRSLRLDFKHPAGREALLRVAAGCDVLVTNLRPGALARGRIAYEDVAGVRPNIVYCEAHGYPTDSERADDPAYDDVMQAATGIADAVRIQSGTPGLAPTILVDKLCGLTIAYAVTAALFRRERTGQGERIEVPMVDTATAFVLVEHGAGAVAQPPAGPAGYSRILTPHRRPQRTRDGWIHVFAYTRNHFAALFGQAEDTVKVDPELYASGRARIANADLLYQLVAEVMATRTTGEWMEFCRRADVPATEITSLDDLVRRLPTGQHPETGPYKVIPPPVRFHRSPASVRRPAPLVGQHTEEVLAEAGLAPADVEALRQAGAIPPDPDDR